jgi:hypothetical protein
MSMERPRAARALVSSRWTRSPVELLAPRGRARTSLPWRASMAVRTKVEVTRMMIM